jgi:hypothetical protein
MRSILFAFVLIPAFAQAQKELPPDTIVARLTGCWYAGDGGTEGRYCFTSDKRLKVEPLGKGRHELQGDWGVDKKGNVTVKGDGSPKTVYLVERLEADGFVLVTEKDGIRLEGHKEPPKKKR